MQRAAGSRKINLRFPGAQCGCVGNRAICLGSRAASRYTHLFSQRLFSTRLLARRLPTKRSVSFSSTVFLSTLGFSFLSSFLFLYWNPYTTSCCLDKIRHARLHAGSERRANPVKTYFHHEYGSIMNLFWSFSLGQGLKP